MPPEINLIDLDGYARDGIPHDQLTWLRANAPVYWHPDEASNGGGFWAITKHEDVVHVSRHSDIFSSWRRLALMDELTEPEMELQRMMMLNQDPPEHTRRRSLVNRGFTPRMIHKLEPHVRDICNALIDDVAARGSADFVRDIAAPLPLYVICELIGAPVEDRDRMFDLSNRLIGTNDPEFGTSMEDGANAAAELYGYANELAERRRAEPRDDIITKLLQADDSGETLTVDEFDLFFLLLTVAGNETTRNAASGGMLAFFENPDQWARLCADRSLIESTAEEIVRWVSPVNLFRRTATRDTEIRGQQIKEGAKVVVFYPSANRDEAVFQDPFTFDIGRDPNPHVGFGGGGAHFCLGNHLAELELRVLFNTLADRMPDIELAGNVRRLRSNFINGIKQMPVGFTPTA